MAPQITVLALACVLLLAHILLAAQAKTRQFGIGWNIGARDEALPALAPIAGRLERARANFLETFPLAIVALLGVVVAGKATEGTAIAGWVWLGARAIYLPLYWAGIPRIRTLVWGVGLLALLYVLGVLLGGAWGAGASGG